MPQGKARKGFEAQRTHVREHLTFARNAGLRYQMPP